MREPSFSRNQTIGVFELLSEDIVHLLIVVDLLFASICDFLHFLRIINVPVGCLLILILLLGSFFARLLVLLGQVEGLRSPFSVGVATDLVCLQFLVLFVNAQNYLMVLCVILNETTWNKEEFDGVSLCQVNVYLSFDLFFTKTFLILLIELFLLFLLGFFILGCFKETAGELTLIREGSLVFILSSSFFRLGRSGSILGVCGTGSIIGCGSSNSTATCILARMDLHQTKSVMDFLEKAYGLGLMQIFSP